MFTAMACLSACADQQLLSSPFQPSFTVKSGMTFGLGSWCLGLFAVLSVCPAVSYQ